MGDATLLDIFNVIWSVLVAVTAAIVLFAKAFNRLDVIEEKIKVLLSLLGQFVKALISSYRELPQTLLRKKSLHHGKRNYR